MMRHLILFLAFSVACSAAEPYRVFYTGHSFAGAPPAWLGILAKQAAINDYENVGRQSLGGSRVIDHWKLADARNEAGARHGACGCAHTLAEHADAR